MRAAGEQRVQPCPQCGVEIRADRRFTTWCAAGWRSATANG